MSRPEIPPDDRPPLVLLPPVKPPPNDRPAVPTTSELVGVAAMISAMIVGALLGAAWSAVERILPARRRKRMPSD